MKNEKLGCQKRKNKYTNLSFNMCYQNMGVSML